MNAADYISIEDIMFEVLQTVNDVDLRKGLAKGWYTQQIKNALEELSFDTFFDEQTLVLDFPSNFRLEMPEDAFNIREIYLFTGSCCTPETSTIVHHKRLFNNKPQGGETGKRVQFNQRGTRDPFYSQSVFDFETITGRIYYYNIQNGMIMFSSNSNSFTKVKLIYNGMGGKVDELPIIPRFFRQAVTYFTIVKQYEYMMEREPRKYAPLHDRASIKLGVHWDKAELRIKRMDTHEKEELNQYLSRPNIG